jgi:outer membrane protein assembly factor BamB
MSLVIGRFLVVALGLVGRLEAAKPDPLPCAAEALAATAEIRTLVSVVGLGGGLQNALDSKLDAAEQSIGNGNPNAASGQLGALRNQVQALLAAGDISAADAQALLDAIDAALAVVRTCSSLPRLDFFNVRSGHGDNTLFWVNPTTPSYAQTLILFRTDTYPTGPADPGASVLGTFSGAPGAVGSAPHPSLSEGTTYFYAAYAQDGQGLSSAAKISRGRPDNTSPFLWSYTISRSIPIAFVIRNVMYSAFSDDAIHELQPGASGGGWPALWKPARIPAPADARPVGPLTMPIGPGGANLRATFASSRTGQMYAVNADTGDILWTSPDLGGAIESSPSGTFLPASEGGGLLFVGVKRSDGSGTFYALKAVDGTVAWSFDDSGALGAVTTQPAMGSSSRIFFSSRARGSEPTVWCLNYTDKSATVQWSARPGDVNTAPSTRPPAVYVANTAGEVHALNLDTGDTLWNTPYNTGDGPVSRFVFSDRFSNRLYLSTAHQSQALEDNGSAPQPIWSIPLPSPSVPVRYVDSVFNDIYIAAGDGRLYIVDDAATATPTPAFVTVGDPANPAALGQLTFDTLLNIVTVGSADGVLYALSVPFTSFPPPGP